MKRVLITGIGGFVASHCLEYFLENTGWELICIDSFRHKGTCSRITESVKNPRVKILTHDLTVPIDRQLENLIFDRKIDNRGYVIEKPINFIFNIASDSAVERSIVNPVYCLRNNFELTINMLEFARNCKGLEMFLHLSSDEIFGEAGPNQSHKEWDTPIPSNIYASSKAAQENLMIGYWRTFNMPIVIATIMNMIGSKQDPEKFIPKLIQKIYLGEEMPIYADSPDKIGSRMYLHAKNMANALVFISSLKPTTYNQFQGNTWEARPDKYNVCGDQELNNLEMAQLVAKTIGKPLKYKLIPSESARPGYDRRYALDGSKLRNLGWKPHLNLEQSIREIVEWTLNNPHWII